MATLSKFCSYTGEHPPQVLVQPRTGDWESHRYPDVYQRQKTTGPERLMIAASEKGSEKLLQLTSVLRGEFALLYVLSVPRGKSEAGRYQTPWMDAAELKGILQRYGPFFDGDGRHHIWIFSHQEKATLVYDRHNVIYAYGPLEDFERIVCSWGFEETESLSYPTPHSHSYNEEYDEDERRITSTSAMTYFPLQPGDEV